MKILKYLFIAIFVFVPFAVYGQTNTISSNTVVDKSVPAAMAPNIMINNVDVCMTGTSAGVTTQIFGIAGSTTTRDKNCEVVKLFRLLYGGGMKVAAISLICQDARVFDAMWRAGTPCPADKGLIGDEAKTWWLANAKEAPEDSIIYKAAIKEEQKHIAPNNWPEDEWQGD